jgi:hypothetical protein
VDDGDDGMPAQDVGASMLVARSGRRVGVGPTVRLAAGAGAGAGMKKRGKKRAADGRPPFSLSAAFSASAGSLQASSGPSSMASSVRFLDSGDHEQNRARFVPDTTSEDESCADDLSFRVPTGMGRRRGAAGSESRAAPSRPAPPPPSNRRRPRKQSETVSDARARPQQSENRRTSSTPPRPAHGPQVRKQRELTDDNAAGASTAVGPRVLRSLGSWSSSMSSSSQVFRLSIRPSSAAAASSTAFEQRLLSSSTYSTSSQVEDGVLIAHARQAKKQIEAVAKRQVMVGKWKPLVRSKPDCQVFDSSSAAKDEYSVVAKLNLPCSLREIMNVFATDHVNEFHRSMEALFGDLYVYGVGLRSVDCGPMMAGRASGATHQRRSSVPARRPSFPAYLPQLRTAKLSLNAVSLLQKHGLVWKQRNMCFLDFLEEKIDDKAVIRVLRTMDDTGDDEDDDDPSSVSMSSSTAGSSSRHTHTQHMHSSPDDRDRRRELHGITVGYILQEDSEEKFTRLFFYASVRRDLRAATRKVSQSAVQLLRAMAMKVCALESVVLRRRLGYYPLVPTPSEGSNTQVAYCSACYIPFSMLRKKHFCRLCGHYTCRKCSSAQAIEKTVGVVGKHRVCVTCVRRVSYCVFTMGSFPPKTPAAPTTTTTSSGSNALEASCAAASLSEIPEDDSPPILEDLAATTIEDIAMLNPEAGNIRAYMKNLVSSRPKAIRATRSTSDDVGDAVRRLSGSDIDAWMDDVEPAPDHSTPPEAISILGSMSTSHSSASSRDVRPWYPSSSSPPPSPTRTPRVFA